MDAETVQGPITADPRHDHAVIASVRGVVAHTRGVPVGPDQSVRADDGATNTG